MSSRKKKTVGSLGCAERRFLFGRNGGSFSRLGALVSELLQRKPDVSACARVIRLCGDEAALEQGKRVHAYLLNTQGPCCTFLFNLLIQMYGKCGDLQAARHTFDSMQQRRNKFSWSSLISAYAHNRHFSLAFAAYRELLATDSGEVDDAVLVAVLGACASSRNVSLGEEIHKRVACASSSLLTPLLNRAIVNMYVKCGKQEQAMEVLQQTPSRLRDAKAWNVVFAANAQERRAQECLSLFQMMERQGVKPDAFTFSAALAACSSAGNLEAGREIHQKMIDTRTATDLALDNALLNMYAKCGQLLEAQEAFDSMKQRDVISWTTIIGGYAENGQSQKALSLYVMLEQQDVKPNAITHAYALCACASLGDLVTGKAIHEKTVREEWEQTPVVGSALINMYAKCSCIDQARAVFNRLSVKDTACSNAMLAAYAQFGHLLGIEEVFMEMLLHGAEPTAATLVSILIGCSRAGEVESGRERFVRLLGEHAVEAVGDHYLCMVDMLGRVGKLSECEELIKAMPFQPSSVAWITFLSASRAQDDNCRGQKAILQI